MSDEMWPKAESGAMRGCPIVRGRCPSCGNSSLALGSGGYVTCASPRCKRPCLASDALQLREPGWLDEWAEIDEAHRADSLRAEAPTERNEEGQ